IRQLSRTGRPAARPVQDGGIGQQVFADVGIEVPEHVPVLLLVEDLVPERPEKGGAHVPVAMPQREIQPSAELREGVADDLPVGGRDMAVRAIEADTAGGGWTIDAVQDRRLVHELDPTGTGAVGPAL